MKKILLSILIICIMFSSAVHAQVNDDVVLEKVKMNDVNRGTGLSLDKFSVTVPTTIVLKQDGSGNVISGNGNIINNSKYPVEVSNVKINVSEGWSLVSYDEDIRNMYIDTKKIGLNLNGKNVGVSGVVNTDETFFQEIEPGDICEVKMNAVMTSSSTDSTDIIGNVIYIFNAKKPKLPKKVTWADGTDQEIEALIKAADEGLIDLAEYAGWKVGDERVIHHKKWGDDSYYNSLKGYEQDITWIIMDKGGVFIDNDKKCNFVIGMKDVYKGYIYEGYRKDILCSYESYFDTKEVAYSILNSLPVSFTNMLKPHIKYYDKYDVKSKDGIFKTSALEKISMLSKDNILEGEEQFEYYRDKSICYPLNFELSDFSYIKKLDDDIITIKTRVKNGEVNWYRLYDLHIPSNNPYNLLLYACI